MWRILLSCPEYLYSMSGWILIFFLIICSIIASFGFNSPGLVPVVYCDDDDDSRLCERDIPIYVNRLDSGETVLPYGYKRFDFCQATSDEDCPTENLGQVVFGERIQPSPYKTAFLEDKKCEIVCKKSYEKGENEGEMKMQFILDAVRQNYQHHWIVDDLPITWCYPTETGGEFCSRGFPVGCYVNKEGVRKESCFINEKFNERDTYYLFNHVDILITYNSGEGEEWGSEIGLQRGQIVGATLTPRSIRHKSSTSPDACNTGNVMAINSQLNDTMDILYSFSISFLENNKIKWSSRWDYILNSVAQADIQWFSIIDSVTIVLYFGGSLAIVLFRALHRHIVGENQMDIMQNNDEFSCKPSHTDTHHLPRRGLLLSVLLGSATQMGITAFLPLAAVRLGFLSVASPGTLITYSMILFVCLATPAGYVSSRLYKMFGSTRWVENALLTSLLCPGVVFATLVILRLTLWANNSPVAIPLRTLLTLPAPWLLVSTPLVFLGAYLGSKNRTIEQPLHTNKTSCPIPERRFSMNLIPGMAGIVPYGLISIQLFFILHSIWSYQSYCMLRFLFLVAILLALACSELTTFLRYYRHDTEKTSESEFCWRLISGDVLRAPRCGMLLSVFLGSGVQIGITAVLTLLFACLGILSPANPGALVMCPMVLFVCLGTPAGYVSSRFYKHFGGNRCTLNTFLTSALCPGAVFTLFLIMNVVLRINHSSAAIPYVTLLSLIIPWLFVSTPLVFYGAHLGSKHRALEQSVYSSEIPRQIPDHPILIKPVLGVIMGGFLPFSCISLELLSILISVWSHQFYNKFDSLFLVLMLVMLVCAELTVSLCYLHICAEDYRWCWRSFFTGGGTAFYVFLYCLVYFFAKLDISGAASTFLYFGYTIIVVFLFFLFTGTVGFLSSWWFVQKIFGTVRSTANQWP